MLYGLIDKNFAIRYASEACEIVAPARKYQPLTDRHDVMLLLETAAQETHLGAVNDRTVHGAGVGLCQIDPIGFIDVQQRCPGELKEKVRDALGCSINDIHHRDLAFSPALSFLFCRLFYRLRPGSIPGTLEGRAVYWKTHFNSRLGKGTVEEYTRNAKRFVYPLIGVE